MMSTASTASTASSAIFIPEELMFTGDPTRDAIIRKFIEILQTPPLLVNHDTYDEELKTRAAYLAVGLEEALNGKFKNDGKGYNDKARSLLFNLRDVKNPELRNRLIIGDLMPYDLANLDAKHLASD